MTGGLVGERMIANEMLKLSAEEVETRWRGWVALKGREKSPPNQSKVVTLLKT